MLNNYWSESMDKDALIKLAGEQALYQSEHDSLLAPFNRDRVSLSGLSNTSNSAGDPEWLASGCKLLERIHSNKARIDALSIRIAELKKLTGL
jgi:hypothetical protein